MVHGKEDLNHVGEQRQEHPRELWHLTWLMLISWNHWLFDIFHQQTASLNFIFISKLRHVTVGGANFTNCFDEHQYLGWQNNLLLLHEFWYIQNCFALKSFLKYYQKYTCGDIWWWKHQETFELMRIEIIEPSYKQHHTTLSHYLLKLLLILHFL